VFQFKRVNYICDKTIPRSLRLQICGCQIKRQIDAWKDTFNTITVSNGDFELLIVKLETNGRLKKIEMPQTCMSIVNEPCVIINFHFVIFFI